MLYVFQLFHRKNVYATSYLKAKYFLNTVLYCISLQISVTWTGLSFDLYWGWGGEGGILYKILNCKLHIDEFEW